MLDSNSNPDLDQTQFGSEGWLYDGNKSMPAAVEDSLVPKNPVWWQTKKGKTILVAMALVSMLSLILVGAILKSRQPKEITDETLDETVIETMNLGPLGDKVKALRAQLRLADPTKELDPFPPVKSDLRLDAQSDR